MVPSPPEGGRAAPPSGRGGGGSDQAAHWGQLPCSLGSRAVFECDARALPGCTPCCHGCEHVPLKGERTLIPGINQKP